MNQLIALVDDDPSARDAAASLVRALGFDVVTFASAAEFLQSPERAQAACLIVDMRMPGMNGLELHRHLTASGALLPTVMVTAHPSDDGRDQALAAGVRAYLAKPLEPDTLYRSICSAIQGARPRGSKPRTQGEDA